MSNLPLFHASKPDAAIAGGGSAAAPATADPEMVSGGHKGAGVAPEGAPAPSDPSPIGIYKITGGISMYVWLCQTHLAARLAGPIWMSAERIGDLLWHGCDDCNKEPRNEGSATWASRAARFNARLNVSSPQRPKTAV